MTARRAVTLLLEDGACFAGEGFGAEAAVGGEVVFNTGMAGYVESLTDPSYRGQVVVFTYPLIGNYGAPAPRPASSIEPPFESDAIQPQGVVVQHYVAEYSHHGASRSLGDWLASEGVPGVTGIDTRALTQRLREHGTMRGWLLPGLSRSHAATDTAHEIDMQEQVFFDVAPDKPRFFGGGDIEVALIDVGAKDNIVRSLQRRGASVNRVPWHDDVAAVANRADAVVIGNGPGDPTNLGSLIGQLGSLLGTYPKPVFGICLGHQILALAAGAETYKLPYGHRSANQPVQDLLTRRCYVTSQNHGYAVDERSVPHHWDPWFVNINDGTNEGLRAQNKPFFSVQFHPEASPGPQDTGFLFDEFLRVARSATGRR